MTDELRAKFEATFPHLDFSADSYGNYYSQRTLDHLYGYQAAHASRDAEVEALKRDAERYRWLRAQKDAHQRTPFICIFHHGVYVFWNGEYADREIDAAMAKESGE